MTSQVFYRKWRPQNLSEVVGQQHITQTLRNAVDTGRIAHAYLFCGPRGTGKTSTGRILAKAINCLKPVKGEPCNECDICKSVNEGSALDIIEIDAASNRGIDEIRDLKERVQFSPNQAKFKVYIIDEVHMITKEAANAFLKTLEEPPAHAIFILATTEPHKVLATVLSRCQRFDFRRLSQDAVIAKLEYICKREKIKIEPEALRLVARATTGSLRDAENVLEQLVAFYGHSIDLHQVQGMLGVSSDLRTKELANYIINKDMPAGLNTINSIGTSGVDIRQFNRELVNYLRDLLLVKSGSEDVVDATSDDLAEMKKMVEAVSLDFLLAAVKQFGDADIRLDSYSTLPLELALISAILKTGETNSQPDLQPDPQNKVVDKKPAMHVKTRKPVEEQGISQPSSIESSAASNGDTENTGSPGVSSKEKDIESEDSPVTIIQENKSEFNNPEDISTIKNRWNDFVKALRGVGSKGNLDAMLRSACEPLSVQENVITLGFYAKFHKEYIEDQKYKFLVEKKLLEFFGKPYKIKCILIEKPSGKDLKRSSPTDSPAVRAALQRGAKLIE